MTGPSVQGVVVAGHGVASGRASDPRFPGGTIALQIPIFRQRGIDLADLIGEEPVMGTINLDVSPLAPDVIEPEIVLPAVTWSPQVPAENFWLFRAGLVHAGRSYGALVYMPDPSTKPDHFQPTGVVEIIAGRVAGLAVGDRAELAADPAFLRFAPRS